MTNLRQGLALIAGGGDQGGKVEGRREGKESTNSDTAALSELVSAAVAGDRESLEKLLKQLLPSVRNLVRLFCGSDRDVDDLTQEVLLVIVKRISSFEARSAFRTWVYGVTYRVVRGRMRNQWYRRAVFGLSLEERRSDASVHADYERRRAVLGILDNLSPKQREVMVMHHALEMTLPEVAEALNVSVETARSRLRLARAQVRKLEASSV